MAMNPFTFPYCKAIEARANRRLPAARLGSTALILLFILCVTLACNISRPQPSATAYATLTPTPTPTPAMGKSWAAPPTPLPTVTFPPPVEDQAILDQAEQSFQQGHEAYNSGYLQQAMDAFNAALEKNPRYALAYQYRGWTYLKQNTSNYLGTYLETNDKAILDLTRSIALDPVQWLPYYGRGIAFHNRAQVEPLRDNRKQWQALALADLERALELDQEQGRVRGERVEIYLEQGQCDKALDDLMSPYLSNITQSDEILYYIRTYLCQKNYSEADRLVNEELANGATANLYWERAMVYVGQKDYEKALQDMDSATQIQAGSFAPGTMLYTRAAIEYFLGEDDLALQDIQQGQNQTWIDWGTPYYFLGKIYLKRGDTLQAMSAFLWAEQTLEEGSLLNATRDELRQLGVYPTQTPTPRQR
jgi:tetratricopeptide (TPR) repeat protein